MPTGKRYRSTKCGTEVLRGVGGTKGAGAAGYADARRRKRGAEEGAAADAPKAGGAGRGAARGVGGRAEPALGAAGAGSG